MTKELESIYCVECLSLQPREAAELIFRTGFYKVKVPLGHCKKCAAAAAAATAAAAVAANGEAACPERTTADSRLPVKAKLA